MFSLSFKLEAKVVSTLISLIFLTLQVQGRNQTGDFDWTTVNPSTSLNWVPCYTPATECTKFSVPLNYSDPTVGSAALALIRIPSTDNTSDSYRGPVLFNPGGPGGSGIQAILSFGSSVATVIGTNFDLVSFDPRGVGNSTPAISFFKDNTERAAFDFGPNALDVDPTTENIPFQWAQVQTLGRVAKARNGDVLPYVTTDNVARDMLSIVEAHGQEKLQYWGISYGSVLGATFASMFPDKVERLIIDGVLDMPGYYATNWVNQTLDADKALQTFFDGCHAAGPDACAFYADSPAAISDNLDDLFTAVALQPVPAFSPDHPLEGVVNHATLKNAVAVATYTPFASFATLAKALSALASGDGSAIFQLSVPRITEQGVAIACSDGVPDTDNASTITTYAEDILPLSNFSSIVAGIRLVCSGWQVHPDNFKGPIGGNTSFPLLVIGNTADPVTPLVGAKKTSAAFPGSVVLTQDSPGHTSFTSPSECTLAAVNAYFQNGTMPAENTICPVTAPLFPAGANSTTASTSPSTAGGTTATAENSTATAGTNENISKPPQAVSAGSKDKGVGRWPSLVLVLGIYYAVAFSA